MGAILERLVGLCRVPWYNLYFGIFFCVVFHLLFLVFVFCGYGSLTFAATRKGEGWSIIPVQYEYRRRCRSFLHSHAWKKVKQCSHFCDNLEISRRTILDRSVTLYIPIMKGVDEICPHDVIGKIMICPAFTSFLMLLLVLLLSSS